MKKTLIVLIAISIILSVNSLAAQLNGTSYRQNVIVSAGGENLTSASYKTNLAIGIISGIINSSSYINRLGFFHLLLLANDQSCTADNQCEGGYCCSNLCKSSACPAPGGGETTATGGGVAAGGGGGGAVPLPLEEQKEEIKDFDLSPSSVKEHIALGSAKAAKIKVKNTGNAKLDFGLSVQTVHEMVLLSGHSFSLEPGQEKEIEANIIGKKLGSYFGEITAIAGGMTKSIDVIVEVKSEQVLFDAKLDIPSAYKEVSPGDDLKAQITLLNVGPARKVDVTATYIIKDKRGNIIDEFSETFAVEKQASYAKSFKIPEALEPGDYIIIVELRYEKSFAVSSELFRVAGKKSLIENAGNLPLLAPVLAIIAVGILFLLVNLLIPKNFLQKIKGKKRK